MTTFYLRLMLLPIIVLTAVLLVIRSQPYDDHELRELLLPEGCPAPCFMGIRPGITELPEIIKIGPESILEIQVNPIKNSQVIDSIDVITSIPYGEIFLLLGGGTSNDYYEVFGQRVQANIFAVYPALNLRVQGDNNCPMSQRKYWNTPVKFHIISSGVLRSSDLKLVCAKY